MSLRKIFLFFVLILTAFVGNSFAKEYSELKLASIFSDNMVLQRGVKIPVWGFAPVNEKVTVTIASQTMTATTGSEGKWMVNFNPITEPGPLNMVVQSKDKTVELKNILIGDVWLCSGQSNMEWSVKNSSNAIEEIRNADYPNIRLFTVTKVSSVEKRDDVTGQWLVCSSKTVSGFSAIGYYFGKYLQENLNVPIGLVNASWGGTRAEWWTPYETLKSNKELQLYSDEYDTLKNMTKTDYDKQMLAFNDDSDKIFNNNTGLTDGWAKPDYDDTNWKQICLPTMWEKHIGNIDGIVWFRKEVQIPAAWTGNDLYVSLGPVDDYDITYFNGEKIGQMYRLNPYGAARTYKVPSGLVKEGKNVVSVRVFDNYVGGGFYGVAESMKLYVSLADSKTDFVTLSGNWKYKVEYATDYKVNVMRPQNIAFFSSKLYNGMIYPLVPFSVKGVIWYQGESNASRAYLYRTLFPSLIKSWREAWHKEDLPFLFVQLANYMGSSPEPEESEWAEVRESQLRTLSLNSTGMAVTIDIGDGTNIHPKDKQNVGFRLGLNALALVYGQKIEYSGPVYKSMKIVGNKIELSFDHVGDGLMVKDGTELKGFAICGADKKFVWAKAEISNDKIIVWSDSIQNPVAVRYAWADNPVCNLYNKSGLPASPFRTDDFPLLTRDRK